MRKHPLLLTLGLSLALAIAAWRVIQPAPTIPEPTTAIAFDSSEQQIQANQENSEAQPHTVRRSSRPLKTSRYQTQQLSPIATTGSNTVFAISPEKPKAWQGLRVGDVFSWQIDESYLIEGIVDSIQHTEQSFSFGVRLADDFGRMSFRQNTVRQVAQLFFNGSHTTHRIQGDKQGWQLTESTVGQTLCSSAHSSYPITQGDTFPRRTATHRTSQTSRKVPASAPTAYQSRPGAPTVIYCDFDGEVIYQPDWSASTINAAASGLSETQIALVLQIVAEDYAPFNVNVTNIRDIYNNTASNKRVMCVSTPTDTAMPDSGGVAFMDSFVDDLVCWNFDIYSALSAADTISHEVGHTLGLEHDGKNGIEYYAGHPASGGETWGPIMGAADDPTITQWSKGDYRKANQAQDDLAIITRKGLSYASDDYGNNSGSAHPLTLALDAVSIDGIIGRSTDIDVFAITFSDLGTIQIKGAIDHMITNLDVRMSVYDANNARLINYTSDATKDASANFTLQPGTYEVRIQGDSSGNPNNNSPTGWTSYGSLGAYTLLLTPDPPTRSQALDNNVTLTDSGDASWFAQAIVSHDGKDALQAGVISNDAESTFSISKQTASIRFWVKVSSEAGYDFLKLKIDGVVQRSWSGEQGWLLYTKNNLPNTIHNFEWIYNKGYMELSGSDTAWIDSLQFDDDSNYATWASTKAASSDGYTDENGNGTADLLDYGLASNTLAGIETGQTIVIPSTKELNFYRKTDHHDITIRIQISETLQTWETVAVSDNGDTFYTKTGTSLTKTTIDVKTEKISLNLGAGAGLKKFARILISKN